MDTLLLQVLVKVRRSERQCGCGLHYAAQSLAPFNVMQGCVHGLVAELGHVLHG